MADATVSKTVGHTPVWVRLPPSAPWMDDGPLSEFDTHLELAVRLGYVRETDTARSRGLAVQVGKMLTRRIHSLLK